MKLNYATSAVAELVQWDRTNSTIVNFEEYASRMMAGTTDGSNLSIAPNAIVRKYEHINIDTRICIL